MSLSRPLIPYFGSRFTKTSGSRRLNVPRVPLLWGRRDPSTWLGTSWLSDIWVPKTHMDDGYILKRTEYSHKKDWYGMDSWKRYKENHYINKRMAEEVFFSKIRSWYTVCPKSMIDKLPLVLLLSGTKIPLMPVSPSFIWFYVFTTLSYLLCPLMLSCIELDLPVYSVGLSSSVIQYGLSMDS